MAARSVYVGAVVIGVVLLTAGCAALGPQFYVNVNGLRDPQAPEKRTYVLYPGLKGVEPTDLQFKEFAAYVHRSLKSRGYAAAEQGGPADVVVFLSYGIGEPQTTYYSYPIFGQVGGGTSSFTASTWGSGGYATTTGTVTSSPQFGIVGTRTGARTEFFRWAVIEAVDVDTFVNTQKVVQLWRTTMASSGSSGDLRRVFPILVAAGQPYIATNTGQEVHRVLNEASPEVVAIRGEKKP